MKKYATIYATIFLSCLMIIACTPSHHASTTSKPADPGFIHSVYFYLNEDAGEAQVQQLISDCKTLLGAVETVRQLYVGLPAGTPRDVVDNSYGVSLIVYFDDQAGHDYYQTAEKHLQFIERNQNAWDRVQVYDMLPQEENEK
ncbi:MAG: Dabb family protein [Candidatus Omnitrophica bacterium]|nr:Dabb family protein [Candidatus Omnitrophota bacterium]